MTMKLPTNDRTMMTTYSTTKPTRTDVVWVKSSYSNVFMRHLSKVWSTPVDVTFSSADERPVVAGAKRPRSGMKSTGGGEEGSVRRNPSTTSPSSTTAITSADGQKSHGRQRLGWCHVETGTSALRSLTIYEHVFFKIPFQTNSSKWCYCSVAISRLNVARENCTQQAVRECCLRSPHRDTLATPRRLTVSMTLRYATGTCYGESSAVRRSVRPWRWSIVITIID